jgi:pyrophosphatase PpaX
MFKKIIMKKYQTILFDWDGCLAKTLEIWLEAYSETFSSFNIQIDYQTIASQVFGDWKGAEKQGVEDLQGFNDFLRSKVNQELKKVDLYEGAKELLVELYDQGKELALLSTSVKKFIEPALKRHGIYEVFDLILDGNEVENHKPDPEVILKAMKFLEAEQNSTIVIGDSKSDLGAAQAAEIDSMLFYPESHKIIYDKESLLSFKPTYVVENFIEAMEVLGQ